MFLDNSISDVISKMRIGLQFVKGDRFAPRSAHPTVGLDTRPVLKPVPGTTEHSYAITPELEALLAKEKH